MFDSILISLTKLKGAISDHKSEATCYDIVVYVMFPLEDIVSDHQQIVWTLKEVLHDYSLGGSRCHPVSQSWYAFSAASYDYERNFVRVCFANPVMTQLFQLQAIVVISVTLLNTSWK